MKSISFCCEREAPEAGGSCSGRTKLEPTSLPPAIKKEEKGNRATPLVTFPSCKSQPASLHTPAPGANSRAGTWQASGGTQLPEEPGRVCVCVCERVRAHRRACFLPACRLLRGGGSGMGELASFSRGPLRGVCRAHLEECQSACAPRDGLSEGISPAVTQQTTNRE